MTLSHIYLMVDDKENEEEEIGMGIVLARLDNRLLHGIVATQWAPSTGANRIMVVDDEVASDPVLKEGMRLGKPPGTAVSIITTATAIQNFKSKKYDGQKVFLIAKEAKIILALLESGESIDTLILGGSVVPDQEATAVSARFYVVKDDLDVYRKIYNYGTNLVVQYVPTDTAKKLTEIVSL